MRWARRWAFATANGEPCRAADYAGRVRGISPTFTAFVATSSLVACVNHAAPPAKPVASAKPVAPPPSTACNSAQRLYNEGRLERARSALTHVDDPCAKALTTKILAELGHPADDPRKSADLVRDGLAHAKELGAKTIDTPELRRQADRAILELESGLFGRVVLDAPYDASVVVRSATWSLDGRSLYAVDGNGLVVSDTTSWAERRAASHAMNAVQRSADGKVLATREGERLIVRDQATLAEITTVDLKRPERTVANTALTRDGKSVIVQYTGHEVVRLDLRSKRALWTIASGSELVELGPNDTLVMKYGDRLALGDAATGKKKTDLGLIGIDARVAFSADGKLIAASMEGEPKVRLWNAKGAKLRTIDLDLSPRDFAFTSDGSALAIGLDDVLTFTRVEDGKPLPDRRIQVGAPIRGVMFSPSGTLTAIFTENGLSVWDPTAKKIVHGEAPTRRPRGTALWSAAVTKDRSMVATVSDATEVRIWDLGQHAIRRLKLPTTMPMSGKISFSPNGSKLLVPMDDGKLFFIDPKSATVTETRLAKPPAAIANGVPMVQLTAATALDDGVLVLTQDEVRKLGNDGSDTKQCSLGSESFSAVFSAEGTRVARYLGTGADVFDTKTCAATGTIPLTKGLLDFALSPSGGKLAIASESGTVTMWDAATGAKASKIDKFAGSSNTGPLMVVNDDVVIAGRDGEDDVNIGLLKDGSVLRLVASRGVASYEGREEPFGDTSKLECVLGEHRFPLSLCRDRVMTTGLLASALRGVVEH